MVRMMPQYVSVRSAACGAFVPDTLLGWTSPAQTSLINGEYPFPVDENAFSGIGLAIILGTAFVYIHTYLMVFFSI